MENIEEKQLAWFDSFWSEYPRKIAKLAALKAWKRVATREAVIEQIMAGLRAQNHIMITKDKSFIPHASTWLNGRRWEDDHIAPVSTPRVIACAKCGDTGVVGVGEWTNLGVKKPFYTEPCSCPRGQLPGLAVGPIDARDAL